MKEITASDDGEQSMMQVTFHCFGGFMGSGKALHIFEECLCFLEDHRLTVEPACITCICFSNWLSLVKIISRGSLQTTGVKLEKETERKDVPCHSDEDFALPSPPHGKAGQSKLFLRIWSL